jgi:DNA-binding NarL/FixJ family response regulator
MIRVAIVEDSPAIREGLSLLIDGSEGFSCRQAYTSAEDAIKHIPQSPPDVVLMDINLPGISGIEAVRQLKLKCPATQFMMCTIYENDEHIFESLKVGANGYILKKTAPAKMLESITEIFNGGSPMSGQIARKVITAFQTVPRKDEEGLSDRELEIVDALAKGYRYKEIADRYFVSIETVRSHIRNIYEKLQVHSRTDAINKVYKRNV